MHAVPLQEKWKLVTQSQQQTKKESNNKKVKQTPREQKYQINENAAQSNKVGNLCSEI
jgi:hypothetical protein